jgi:hypothetical protein
VEKENARVRAFFSFVLGAFAFFALFYLRAFALFFGFALASAKAQKKRRRPPLQTAQYTQG